jgi:hypothetical protein
VAGQSVLFLARQAQPLEPEAVGGGKKVLRHVDAIVRHRYHRIWQ